MTDPYTGPTPSDDITDDAETPSARLEREADPGSPDHALSVFEERRRLQRALEDLPPEQREALLLRLEQELSLEEIAAITGAGRETVKSRLRYAMDKLKARLSRTGELDAPAAKGSNR